MSLPAAHGRLEQLLADEATEGLAADERRELEAMLGGAGEDERSDFELAAAAVNLVLVRRDEEMPDRLAAVVSHQARGFFAGRASSAAAVVARLDVRPFPRPDASSSGRSFLRVPAWWVAAAALLLAVVAWWPRFAAVGPAEEGSVLGLSEQLARSADLLRLELGGTDDPAASGAGGELLWSTGLQAGEMHIRGLAVNDPTVYQYQLWIFDADRDERYPIDGGVFDVPAGTDLASVPIAAKLGVDHPTLFAVTVERPGGVVVSGRERIVLVAQAG